MEGQRGTKRVKPAAVVALAGMAVVIFFATLGGPAAQFSNLLSTAADAMVESLPCLAEVRHHAGRN